MKKVTIGTSIISIVLLTVLLVGCGINKDFVKIMDKTNKNMMQMWEQSYVDNPEMQRLRGIKGEKDYKILVERLMSQGHAQRKAIEEMKGEK